MHDYLYDYILCTLLKGGVQHYTFKGALPARKT